MKCKRKYRYILGLVSVAGVFALAVYIAGGNPILFWDFSTWLCVIACPVFLAHCIFGFKRGKGCFALPFRDEAAEKELREGLCFFKTLEKACWFCAVMQTLVNGTQMLMELRTAAGRDDAAALAPWSLLPLLYAALLELAVILPCTAFIVGRGLGGEQGETAQRGNPPQPTRGHGFELAPLRH
jgi:hypothetical protein